MYSFESDYSEGAHPQILDALNKTNSEQTLGYGYDKYTQQAVGLIKKQIGRDNVDVHFLTGGTQTNLVAICAFLRPHEAVISADTGHVEVHETGAIESTGHKVLHVCVPDGKLRPADLKAVLDFHTDEHMVKPRLVYISDTTEIGTIYTKSELTRLRQFCHSHDLLLYLDGARLGCALCAQGNDISLADLADNTDAFYIGGTKNGAHFGEALVICSDALKKDMRFFIKQKGALLAKGRILALQFYALFDGNLYFSLAEHANAMAKLLKDALREKGFAFLSDSCTNQIFPILPNALVAQLQKKFQFIVWSKTDAEHSCIRLVTSWATPESAVQAFIDALNT